ncbi:ABC transporter ATP-binding protein [Paraferrimonas sedimenticola]|uniref:ABC transporter n=1 Tax=Paraferrimonas sedimenticola TaxID=375674 RepID=A0AA37VYK6_9GAMM|nr:ABC transporter ATP-binding protein [Paraferrimonas sedimenticola]GLP95530.1 ABC transporter [Paraferrimonas sedimenticola]
MGRELLRLIGISKAFSQGQLTSQVLDNLDLSLHEGSQLALMGASGSGKSTLLNVIAQFEPADQGQILFDGQPLANLGQAELAQWRRRSLGVVFQQYNLLAPLTARQNIEFCLQLAGKPWSDWVDHCCQRLSLEPLLDKLPYQLSGGQQQRVAIARAIAHQPPLLLADEPTGNLDQEASDQVMALLVELGKASNSAILMVTHSRRAADFLQQRAELHQGQLHFDEQSPQTEQAPWRAIP